jgi:hypothetical protein
MDQDPYDYTDRYNTDLAPDKEAAFQGWMRNQSKSVGRNVGKDLYDYDLRGWWQKNNGPDLSGGHLNDEFKKPNHPTFSDQSQYHGTDGMQGGHWDQQPGDKWSFTPGSTNVYSPQELKDYFKRVEPDSTLVLPESLQSQAPAPTTRRQWNMPSIPWGTGGMIVSHLKSVGVNLPSDLEQKIANGETVGESDLSGLPEPDLRKANTMMQGLTGTPLYQDVPVPQPTTPQVSQQVGASSPNAPSAATLLPEFPELP